MLMLYICYTVVLGVAFCTGSHLPPVVAAPAGTFYGTVLTSASGTDYLSYRGIPYALPPTGDRRFALPEAFPSIKNAIFNASTFGALCVQHIDGLVLGQEDCLFLNVYTPLISKDSQNKQKKVLVFIHGGGYVLGGSNPYTPGDLVTKGDLIVVTFNYRLGWLGFLRGNHQSLPGNQALHDQVLALKWVKHNIAAFGGDSDDVTLSGESAGAISVSVLSISPLTVDLFTKAIIMSGTAFSFPTPSQQSRDLLGIAERIVGCENQDTVISCLQQQPAEKFHMEFSFAVLVKLISSGDDLLPRPIPELINDQAYLDNVGFYNRTYVVSVTADDGYIRINSRFGKLNTTSLESSIVDISSLLGLPEYVAESLVLEYFKSYEDVEKAVIALSTDYFYIQRSQLFLESYGKRSALKTQSVENNIYFLSFAPVPKYFPKHYAVHAMDLVYLFDLAPKEYFESFYFLETVGDFSDEDLQLKSAFIRLVATIVNTGNPNDYLTQERNILWPPYDDVHKNYLSFSLQPSVHQNLYGDRHLIWNELVPRWKKEYEALLSKQEL